MGNGRSRIRIKIWARSEAFGQEQFLLPVILILILLLGLQ
jgi:hypothetical protein